MTIKYDADVLAVEDSVIETRRHFHAHPEASLKEYETAKYIRNALDKLGVDYVTVGETGTLATIKGAKPGKTILLRGDIDALELQDTKTVPYASKNEGLCHACGHDAHGSALLGALRVLNGRKDNLAGTIKFAFQQAEEIGAGARIFVADGLLEDVDYAFGLHVASHKPSGTIDITPGPKTASTDNWTITVKGYSGHASRPNEANDAALASASILVELQALISRQKDPLHPAVISVGSINSGTRRNVVASSGELQGTLRCLNQETREDLLARIEKVAKLVAEVHGCTAEFENYNAAEITLNDDQATAYAQEVLTPLFGQDKVITNSTPGLGGEDFADFSQVVPSCFMWVGTQSGPENSAPHHHGDFDIDESQLKTMVQVLTDLAVNSDKLP